MALDLPLSDALTALLGSFEPHIDSADGVTLSEAETLSIVLRLRLLAKMAQSMEEELAVHRLLQVTRTARINMNDLATDALMQLSHDRGGNVIKPDFGRKS